MKVVFFGTSHYVLPIIKILKKQFQLVLVLTTEKNDNEPVRSYCKKKKINYIDVERFTKEIIEQIKLEKAQLGVLAYFGIILPQELLDIFPKGIINTHPSLLPKYRGPTPGQTTILNGDKKSGVTVIKLDSEVDHGPILDQVELELKTDETSQSLYERFFKVGAKMLLKVISNYIKGQTKLTPQGDSKATYTQHLTKNDGYIDLRKIPTDPLKIVNWKLKIDRMVRAYYPWPGVWLKTKLGEQNRIVKLLPEQKIQVEGKKLMSFKDFINGYKEGKSLLENLGLT